MKKINQTLYYNHVRSITSYTHSNNLQNIAVGIWVPLPIPILICTIPIATSWTWLPKTPTSQLMWSHLCNRDHPPGLSYWVSVDNICKHILLHYHYYQEFIFGRTTFPWMFKYFGANQKTDPWFYNCTRRNNIKTTVTIWTRKDTVVKSLLLSIKPLSSLHVRVTWLQDAASQQLHPVRDTAGTGSLASSSGTTDATRFHPPHTYSFPKRSFGKKNAVLRSCQSTWFTKWRWLHYDEASDVVFCSVCQRYNTVTEERFSSVSKDTPFVSFY